MDTSSIPDERTTGATKPGDQRMADIIDLIEANHLHILRWQAQLGELRHQPGTRVTGVTLTATWNTLAAMIDLHMRADEEICVLAVCGTGPRGWDLTRHTTEAYRDIREMTGKPACSRPARRCGGIWPPRRWPPGPGSGTARNTTRWPTPAAAPTRRCVASSPASGGPSPKRRSATGSPRLPPRPHLPAPAGPPRHRALPGGPGVRAAGVHLPGLHPAAGPDPAAPVTPATLS